MAVYGIVMLVFGDRREPRHDRADPRLGLRAGAWVVLVLMSIAAIYASYRDIFTDEVSRPEAATVTL